MSEPIREPIQHMDIAEFREFGYLQEVNRRFFHPLGLALAVGVDADGVERLRGIWDCRDDPEGIIFEGAPDPDKATRVDSEQDRRYDPRVGRLGYMVQPVDLREESC